MNRVAIVGAGWAGCAAALSAAQLGHHVTLFEAARTVGGRARAAFEYEGHRIDNGQHILIGAYTATLGLLRQLDISLEQALCRLPLDLRDAQGHGLALPRVAPPWGTAIGILRARGWSLADKISLLQAAAHWRKAGFKCPDGQTVAELCAGLTPAVRERLIDPLCVAALNTPAGHASAQVFLRVLQDALFSGPGGSDLLLPRVDLGTLMPEAVAAWLGRRGMELRRSHRVQSVARRAQGFQVDGEAFDRVILTCPPWDCDRLLQENAEAQAWLARARTLRFNAIATVYLRDPRVRLPRPLLALPAQTAGDAQFVFDRGQLDGPPGLLAFVVSDSAGDATALETAVLAQATRQLGLSGLQRVRTVIEKRATFACVPRLDRPPMQVGEGLLACGDYIAGPYPATLEGAVRSGLAAAQALNG